jgi:hypothetical protein
MVIEKSTDLSGFDEYKDFVSRTCALFNSEIATFGENIAKLEARYGKR